MRFMFLFWVFLFISFFACKSKIKLDEIDSKVLLERKNTTVHEYTTLNEYIDSLSDRKYRKEHFCYKIIDDVSVIDVKNKKVLANQYVVLHDDTIMFVGGKLPKMEGIENAKVLRISGKGKFLSPGLVDMHVHYTCTHERFLYLINGVTTLRNIDSKSLHFEERNLSNVLVGPNLINTFLVDKHQIHLFDSASTDYNIHNCQNVHLRYFDYDTLTKAYLELMNPNHLPVSVEWVRGDYVSIGTSPRIYDEFYSGLSLNDSSWLVTKQSLYWMSNKEVVDFYVLNKKHLLLGTDTRNGRNNGSIDFPVHVEIDSLKKIGISDAEILQIATMNAGLALPYALGLKYGLIQENYKADMVLLSSNPLKNMDSYENVVAFFTKGVYFTNEDIVEIKTMLKKFVQ